MSGRVLDLRPRLRAAAAAAAQREQARRPWLDRTLGDALFLLGVAVTAWRQHGRPRP